MKQNLNIKGPQISSKTLVRKNVRSFQSQLLRRAWLGFLALTLILSPIAGILWNPQHNTALAETAAYGFVKQLGSTSSDQGLFLAVDSSDNVYTTGFFTGTVDFDPGAGTANITSAGANDVFISKLDSSGNFVWAKAMGGTVTDQGVSIRVDSSGNVYTTGNFAGTADFDPGVGTSNLVSAGGNDVFISKLDSSGNFVWAKALGGAGTDQGVSISTDSSGNVFTAGYFDAIADFDPGVGTSNLTPTSFDAFISKLDSDGNFVWAKSFGGASLDFARSMNIDSSGNVYTTGTFIGTVDFDPGAGTSNLVSAGNSDVFISKLDSSGNFAWAIRMGGTGAEGASSIKFDSSGNIYTIGFFSGTADFDPGVGTSNLVSAGDVDVFISKLDSNGAFIYAKKIGGTSFDAGRGLSIDSSDNIYVAGYFIGTSDFDPGVGTSNLISDVGTDIFVLKLDSDGDFVWVKAMGGDVAYSMGIDSIGSSYITGYFTGTADFDPGSSTINLTSAGSEDVYISKLVLVNPPTVSSVSASDLNTEQATLHGNVTDTRGADATERGFEYGLTDSYGTTVSQVSGPYSTGAFSEMVSDLTCSTVYYFRAYATNSEGTSYGSETTFTTSNCSSSGSSSSSSSQSNTQTPTTTPTDTPQTPTTPTDPTQPTFTIPSSGPSGNPSGGQIRSKEGLLPPSLLFTRNLGPGSVGTDVQRLQQFMNTNSYSVSTTGAGATNQETTFFGPRTRAAVKVFQEAFAAEILTPLGLTQGTGYFGNSTRAMLNSLIK